MYYAHYFPDNSLTCVKLKKFVVPMDFGYSLGIVLEKNGRI